MFKNTFFHSTPPVAASRVYLVQRQSISFEYLTIKLMVVKIGTQTGLYHRRFSVNFPKPFWPVFLLRTLVNACHRRYKYKRCFKLPQRYSHMEERVLLLRSVQKFIEIQGWLFLKFFICLHNQLNSFNSIIVQMSEKK